jgi:hypothetical protein
MEIILMNEYSSFILGVLVGLATNLVSWWILAHYVVPRIEFSQALGKLPSDKNEYDRCGFRYRVKLRNGGRRGIIDVELAATLRIEGLSKSSNIEVVPIPWNSEGDKRVNITRLPPVKPGIKAARVLRLYINCVDQFRTRSLYPDVFQKKAEERTLTLEDILGLGSKAWLQISAFGYDEFSGARKLFVSKSYNLEDIKQGQFEKTGLAVAANDETSGDYDENHHI